MKTEEQFQSAVEPPPRIRLDGWSADYPVEEGYKSGFLGYLSDMVHMTLINDDPEAFIYWMRKCGLNGKSLTWDRCSMVTYCRKRNAAKCEAVLDRI